MSIVLGMNQKRKYSFELKSLDYEVDICIKFR